MESAFEMRMVGQLVALALCAIMVIPGTAIAQRETWTQRAIITLTFDDAYADTYSVAFPILKQHNIRATVFVVTSYIGKLSDRLSLGNLLVMQSAGWEIGSHTVSHRRLTQLTTDQDVYEMKNSKEWLRSHGLFVRSLAYPYGAENSSIRELSMQFYDVSRSTTSSCVSYRSIPSDNCVLGVSMPVDHSNTFRYIDNAIAEKSWLIFYLHNLSPNGTIVDNGQDFHEVVDYLAQKVMLGQLEVVTLINGYKRLATEGAIR
jgi:peptidoglycan/xylan/chitin deacetylase (PgdA/CDA1 family)